MKSLYAPDYVVLVVDDLERSLAFYVGQLGLHLGHRAGPYAQLHTGRSRVALYERGALAASLEQALRPPDSAAPGFVLGFKVEDVDAAWQELLAAGVEGVVAPREQPWGQRSAHLRDPDGHLLELIEEPAD